MAYTHTVYRSAVIQPILPNYQVIPRIPMHHQSPGINKTNMPEYLPVLQPPIFPKENDFYEDEEQQYQFNYPTIIVPDQHRTMRQLVFRSPTTFIPLKNYYN